MRFKEYLAKLGGTSLLYGNASNGLLDLLVHLAASSGKSHPNVVLPSYIPAKIYRTALAAGCAVKSYEVRGQCTFDLGEVRGLLDENTVAILYVHYFGFPYQIEEVCSLAAQHAVPLIEDCALTIAATHNGKELGTYGTAALFSMRKVLLYPEGGFLRLGDQLHTFLPRYDWRVSNCYSVGTFMKQRAKYLYVRCTGGADPLRVLRVVPTAQIDLTIPHSMNVKMMSSFSEHRLKYVNIDDVARRRRENFQFIAERFSGNEMIAPMYRSLPEGCTPYSFPLIVLDGRRDHYREMLLRQGVVTGAGWPESPYVPSHHGTALLAQRVLEIPIHQALTRMQLARSLRCLERCMQEHARR